MSGDPILDGQHHLHIASDEQSPLQQWWPPTRRLTTMRESEGRTEVHLARRLMMVRYAEGEVPVREGEGRTRPPGCGSRLQVLAVQRIGQTVSLEELNLLRFGDAGRHCARCAAQGSAGGAVAARVIATRSQQSAQRAGVRAEAGRSERRNDARVERALGLCGTSSRHVMKSIIADTSRRYLLESPGIAVLIGLSLRRAECNTPPPPRRRASCCSCCP